MTTLRSVLTLALVLGLAPATLAQGTPTPPPPWEGQFTDGQATVTLYPRGDAVAGAIDIGGAYHPLRAKVGPNGQLSGTFFAGDAGFGFDARLDGDALLLKSGGKSLRLQRRAAAPAEAGDANPLLQPARARTAPRAPAGDGPDLGHVKVGQRYTFAMLNDLKQVWTVKEVGADFVRYEVSMFLGGDLLGDPSTQEWRFVAPPPGAEQPQQPGADVKVSREAVTVAGVEFDCMVAEASGYKSWTTMTPGSDTVWTFPGILKCVQLSDGAVIMELTKIE